MSRKPRCDSKLKTLTPERQQSIAEFAATHSLVETCEWLKADGLETSIAALSSFLRWHADGLAASALQELLEFGERGMQQSMSADQARSKAIEWTMALAKAQTDPKLMLDAVLASQGERKVGVIERKLELELQKYKDATARMKGELEKAKAKGGLSPETLENIERELKLL